MRRIARLNYLFVFTLVFLTACQPPGPRALLDGDRLIREGKYAEAIPKLQKATQLLPTNAQAWNYLGLAFQYAGKPTEAARAYQQSITLDRNMPAVRFNLGTLYLEQNQINEAINELTTATVLDRGNFQAWLSLGKAQLRARRVDDAERSLVEVLRADPKNVEALNYEGVVQLHRRKARDANMYFNEALKLQPDYSPAVLNQAVLYQYYIVNKTNALAKYREYLAMKPDAAGAAAATEAARALEAELQPRVVTPPPAVVTPTNRLVAMTNRPSAHTNMASPATHTNATIVAAQPNIPPATVTTNAVEAPHVAATKSAVTNKPVTVAATETPKPTSATQTQPPAPTQKTNYVAMAPPVITNAPPQPKVEEKPVEKVEPTKPLEVVTLDEEPKLAVAKDIAPSKPATTTPLPAAKTTPITTAKPAELVAPKDTNTVAASGEMPPLIRPARREEKENAPSLTSRVLHGANPVNWFRRNKDKEEPKLDESEKQIAKKTETTKASGIKELPEPPKEELKEPAPELKPEPVFARYPYQSIPLPKAGNRASAEPLFNDAVTAHQEGKLGKAMDGYRSALRQDPLFFDAELNLGIAAAQASDLSLALATLEDAVRMNPKSTDARYQFAIVLRRANYPLDAVNELKTLIEDSPNETRAYLALGNLYAQLLNKPELAAANYQKVLDLAPQHPQAVQIRSWLSQH